MRVCVVTAEKGLGGHWVVGVYTSRALAERARDDDLDTAYGAGYSGHCITEVELNQQTAPTEGGCG